MGSCSFRRRYAVGDLGSPLTVCDEGFYYVREGGGMVVLVNVYVFSTQSPSSDSISLRRLP